jgi:hypothetical protein
LNGQGSFVTTDNTTAVAKAMANNTDNNSNDSQPNSNPGFTRANSNPNSSEELFGFGPLTSDGNFVFSFMQLPAMKSLENSNENNNPPAIVKEDKEEGSSDSEEEEEEKKVSTSRQSRKAKIKDKKAKNKLDLLERAAYTVHAFDPSKEFKLAHSVTLYRGAVPEDNSTEQVKLEEDSLLNSLSGIKSLTFMARRGDTSQAYPHKSKEYSEEYYSDEEYQDEYNEDEDSFQSSNNYNNNNSNWGRAQNKKSSVKKTSATYDGSSLMTLGSPAHLNFEGSLTIECWVKVDKKVSSRMGTW